MWIVVSGYVSEGLCFDGPFESEEEAEKYVGRHFKGVPYETVQLEKEED